MLCPSQEHAQLTQLSISDPSVTCKTVLSQNILVSGSALRSTTQDTSKPASFPLLHADVVQPFTQCPNWRLRHAFGVYAHQDVSHPHIRSEQRATMLPSCIPATAPVVVTASLWVPA